MSGIKRWDIDCHSMEWMEVEDGDMVKFSDHAAEIARLRAELDNAAAAAVANMSLACQKEREADALRIIAERRLDLIRATLANSEWRHGARNIYAELSKELSEAMGADA